MKKFLSSPEIRTFSSYQGGIRKEHARINTVHVQQEKVDQVESDILDLIISPTRIARLLSAGSVGWETDLT